MRFFALDCSTVTGKLLTADDLAERWQLKPSAVYRLTREGVIPCVKLGRYYRYSPEQIEAYERGEWKQAA